ncbi:MAG: 3-deoxy-D-manno-octulosonic acid transferase [Xanthomarina sp.]|uniref:3-deoxy-D-manno-octulosonic acid transferase n=1 Tax=Xanthomarina sp. TaxID=1931211 RepID=UPI000C406270|nr:glycosyltransferase N-terminal domain-containing protein [Xanthomarina sp.]MAL24019.1 3-deoxy-D-manno-octulosonic acid transferase [Xanthomarina sp.]MBF62422.1 3-deoxy-D-manno-octulosonic acid transferase [Xanthomarina sp.]HAB28269.1 3-deoxy-D-manno-octulosonic acid transferase [Xanthomarina gelatinilytica]HAI17427.1 3-deoxy-D-manno-octulosonic acid transferase [Xanthomarina gelatinilytica]
MQLIYNFGIYVTQLVLKGISIFNHKIKLGIAGRAHTFKILENKISQTDKTLWFHCASLGEYEQGLPVFRELRKDYPKHKIVLSFFSPSGYEIRKNTNIANVVIYLPFDTKSNAKRFLDLVHPELTIFVKYDIWPNFLTELKKRKLRAILISALFRDNQIYFKPYGEFMKKALFAFQHIFTQDETSKKLLQRIGYNDVSVSGDTRFDRVYNQLEQHNSLDFITHFKGDNLCVVAGSTWPEDEVFLIDYINSLENSAKVKFIIAPHNIKKAQILKLKQAFNKKTILYSEKNNHTIATYQVLILDTIGLLSKVYSYANIAYVGGAAGKTGLHNTLEPAVFGIPIIIGEHYNHFPEAIEMLKNQGMFSVKNTKELHQILDNLIKNSTLRKTSGEKNLSYIKNNRGAVIQIMSFLRT